MKNHKQHDHNKNSQPSGEKPDAAKPEAEKPEQATSQTKSSGPYVYKGPCSTAMLDGKNAQSVVTDQTFESLDPNIEQVQRLIDQGHLVRI